MILVFDTVTLMEVFLHVESDVSSTEQKTQYVECVYFTVRTMSQNSDTKPVVKSIM